MQDTGDLPDDGFCYWQRLNDWLKHCESLWRPAPFTEPVPAWTDRFPQMWAWVGALSDDDLHAYDLHPDRLARQLSAFLPELGQYKQLINIPKVPSSDESVAGCTLPESQATDMPGRKREQAGAFAAGLLPLRQPVLDWCCGKGHLSRTLVRAGAPGALGLEWNPRLVEDGNRLAQHFGDPVRLEVCDVMSGEGARLHTGHTVALHACGDLHRRLLQQAVKQGAPRLSLSPCCYHLTSSDEHQPLSERIRRQASRLRLARQEIRLAVRETVTAPQRERKRRDVVSQWRLGFDGLQRTLTGKDAYLPIPPHPAQLVREGFEAFCFWAAEKKGLTIPEDTDFSYWLRYGRLRQDQVRRQELVRHLFRRPLELWLVMDYALFLEEAGYRVRLATFCHRTLTPRNLLLDARALRL